MNRGLWIKGLLINDDGSLIDTDLLDKGLDGLLAVNSLLTLIRFVLTFTVMISFRIDFIGSIMVPCVFQQECVLNRVVLVSLRLSHVFN
jgi:hypothetical protein